MLFIEHGKLNGTIQFNHILYTKCTCHHDNKNLIANIMNMIQVVKMEYMNIFKRYLKYLKRHYGLYECKRKNEIYEYF